MKNLTLNSFFLICIAVAFYFLQSGILMFPGSAEHQLQNYFSINQTKVSLLSVAFQYSYVLMQIPAGFCYDKFNKNYLLLTMILIMSISCLIFSITNHYSIAFISRIVMGFSASFAFLGALLISKEYFSSKQFPLLVGIIEMAGSVSAITFTTIVPQLSKHYGWQATNIGIALIVFMLFIGIIIVKEKKGLTKNAKKIDFSEVAEVFKSDTLWLLGFIAGLMFVHIMVMVNFWNIPYLASHYRMTMLKSGVLDSFVHLGLLIGYVTVSYSRKFTSSMNILSIASVIIAVTVFCSFYVHMSVALEALNLFIMGYASSAIIFVFDIVKTLTPWNKQGIAFGFINMFFGGMSIIFMPLVGHLLSISNNYHTAAEPILISTILLLILVAVFRIRKKC